MMNQALASAVCKWCGPQRLKFLVTTGHQGFARVEYNNGTEEWLPLPQAIPYLVWCRRHKLPMAAKRLKTARTEAPCDDACTHATGATCRCKCGGMNHGIDA